MLLLINNTYVHIYLFITYIYIEFFKNGAEPGTGTISDSDLAAFNVIFHNLKKMFLFDYYLALDCCHLY